jgi:hypothetical protein
MEVISSTKRTDTLNPDGVAEKSKVPARAAYFALLCARSRLPPARCVTADTDEAHEGRMKANTGPMPRETFRAAQYGRDRLVN